MKIEIVKLFLYPKEEPTGYGVGFNIKANNGGSFYIETLLPLESCSGLDEVGIADLAFDTLETEINAKVVELETKSSIVGTEWTPTKLLVETEPISGAPPPFPGE